MLAVGAPTLTSGILSCKVFPLVLDAGSEQGLKVGMDVHVVGPEWTFSLIGITKVERDRAEASLTNILKHGPDPEVGWRVSTRHGWLRRAEK